MGLSRHPREIEHDLHQLDSETSRDDGEKRIWRTVIVPLFGPLWVILPLCVWLLGFGTGLIERFTGTAGMHITASVASIVFCVWAITTGISLGRSARGMSIVIGLVGAAIAAAILSSRLGPVTIPLCLPVFGLLFALSSLLKSAEPVRRIGFALLIHLLLGAVFLYLIGSGIVPLRQPLPRAGVGGCLLLFAWVGWTGITSQSRRLALAYLRSLRGETGD